VSPFARPSGLDRAVELLACAALAVALLFQNPYGELGPEADRFLMLQILALLALVLAAVAPLARAGAVARSLRDLAASPLARWGLALGGTAVVATVAAVDPLRSLFGAPPRLFGLASELALLALFGVLAPRLRAAEARGRWETAGLAATGAMVAYALVQWAGLDPLRWQVDWQGRPTAAQGNPLFLAQALVFLIPVAAGRAVTRWRAGQSVAALAASGLALAAVAVALRTAARGPLLGLAVAAIVFAALAGLSSSRGAARRAGAALAGLLVAAVVAGSWFAWQGAERLTGTAGQRLLLWGSVVRLFEASPSPRLVVGFGPESLAIVLPPHLPPELPERVWRPDLYHDRAHNAVLDALATGGILRLAAGLGLAFVAGLTVLRLAGVRRGNLAQHSDRPGAAGVGERWRFVALAAALGGQAVAAQFGVATAATATLFWLSLALLAGAAASSAEPDLSPAEGGAKPAAVGKRAAEELRRGARRAVRWRWTVAAGMLALVAFGAWVPAQREGDAMGGRVLLLLLLAAGGIGLAFASAGSTPGDAPERQRSRAVPVSVVASVRAASGPAKAGAATVVMGALASLALVQLPQMASGVALKQGRTALEAGRPDLAVAILARAERLFPAFEDPSIALARAEQRLAERAATTGDAVGREAGFGRAAATLAEARRRHPGLSQLALEEAHLAARRADGAASGQEQAALFESAVASYREVLASDPQSSTVHRGLGAALLALGRLEEAGRELETSVRLAPRSLESWLLLGRLRLSAGDERAAREAFQAARELDAVRSRRLLEGLVRARPADPSALRDLALFEIVEGRRKAAIAAIERAMALTLPQDLPPLVRLTGLAAALP
jgi:tetratricopeptide (TPR) repeat protein